jgi:regulator of sigma E protease
MLTVFADIFWFIVTFSILVILHEGGHFLVARAFGVHVHEFMIGLPGPAIRYHGKKTDYGVTAIPLGGYVRISGMEPGAEDPRLGNVLAYVTRRREVTADETARDLGLDLDDAEMLLLTLTDWAAITRDKALGVFGAVHPAEAAEDPSALIDLARSTTFRGLTTFKRILVLAAGVVVNLISAILVFFLVLTLVGLPTVTLTISQISPKSGAAKAGVRVGETVQAIDGQKVASFERLVAVVGKHHPGETVNVTLTQNGSTRIVPVTLSADGTRTIIGIMGSSVNVPMPAPQALAMSVGFLGEVFKAIGGFFNPNTFEKSVQGSTGVVGIAVMAGQQAALGPVDFAFFIAILSLSLGAMNILPIPPLDGGKVVLELIEAVRRKPLPRNVTIGISLVGTLMLVALIGYLMYADILRIVQGS